MSERTTTVWTCARCNMTETVNGMDQPSDWTRWYFATPPRSGTQTMVGDLCNECGGFAVEFIHQRDEEAILRARELVEAMERVKAS